MTHTAWSTSFTWKGGLFNTLISLMSSGLIVFKAYWACFRMGNAFDKLFSHSSLMS